MRTTTAITEIPPPSHHPSFLSPSSIPPSILTLTLFHSPNLRKERRHEDRDKKVRRQYVWPAARVVRQARLEQFVPHDMMTRQVPGVVPLPRSTHNRVPSHETGGARKQSCQQQPAFSVNHPVGLSPRKRQLFAWPDSSASF